MDYKIVRICLIIRQTVLELINSSWHSRICFIFWALRVSGLRLCFGQWVSFVLWGEHREETQQDMSKVSVSHRLGAGAAATTISSLGKAATRLMLDWQAHIYRRERQKRHTHPQRVRQRRDLQRICRTCMPKKRLIPQICQKGLSLAAEAFDRSKRAYPPSRE